MASSASHECLADGIADCFDYLAGTDFHKCCSCQCIGRSGSLSCLSRRCDSVPSAVNAMVFFYEAQVAAISDISNPMENLNAAILTVEDA